MIIYKRLVFSRCDRFCLHIFKDYRRLMLKLNDHLENFPLNRLE